MTIAELIAMVDEIRPNQISKQTKTMWLDEIENRVFDEVICRARDCCPFFAFKPYVYDLDDTTQLAAPDVYSDVYRTYLFSKIDVVLGEIDRYNNDAALFSAAWNDYAAWYRRNHYPKERRHHYGKAALFIPKHRADTTDDTGVSGTEPEPCHWYRGICRYDECFRPVLPCHCCQKAERHDTDNADEP